MSNDLSGLAGLLARVRTRAAVGGGGRTTAMATMAAAMMTARFLVPAETLSAQSVTLSATGAHADHALLDDMRGFRFVVEPPFGKRSLALRLGVSRLTSSRRGPAFTCSGLSAPGQQCAAEPARTTGALTWVLLGISGRVFERPGLELRVAADALAGNTRSRTAGQTSGRVLNGSEIVLGGAADATVRWYPGNGRLGVALGAGYTATGIAGGEQCVDCYIAFDRGPGVGMVSLGVTYRGR
ncbi:MAG: hypothetical protein V4617_21740 [Gemmatimonadota bacterium]